ncbi:MAG: hypothetical protein HYT98_01775 [Candidatus Sungbacteria bacterium]|nr:hypothetical protein [Candidatus Sungbacteria bacterium]
MNKMAELNLFYCSRCNKPSTPNYTNGSREYANEAFVMSYFLCKNCRLIFISKRLLRKEVRAWWKRNNLKRQAPFKYFYEEAYKCLYGPEVLEYHKRIGYKLAHFKQKIP